MIENKSTKFLEGPTHAFVKWAGTLYAFSLAFMMALFFIGRGVSGIASWQTELNTFTSFVTFLMIFLMQRSQNKEFAALQVKLTELIKANNEASNDLINIESSTERHIEQVHQRHSNISPKDYA